MKKLNLLSIIITALLLMVYPAKAQETRTMTFDASTSLMLQEFQAMLVEEDGEIKVKIKMGSSDKPGDKLEQGDFIIMMNGKRTKTITELRELYESLKKDEEVKIGVRRGNERFILRKIKGDIPEGEGGGRRMVMKMDTEGDGEPATIIPELGLMLSDNDGSVSIQRVIEPLLPEEFKALDLAGFSIASINGTKPKDAAHAKLLIAEVEVGEDLAFSLSKPDDEIKVSIKKPKSKGNFSFSTDG
jgi:hypothetical protein